MHVVGTAWHPLGPLYHWRGARGNSKGGRSSWQLEATCNKPQSTHTPVAVIRGFQEREAPVQAAPAESSPESTTLQLQPYTVLFRATGVNLTQVLLSAFGKHQA